LFQRLRSLAPPPPGARPVLEADRKPDGALRQDDVFRYVVATKP
jgi:hypothetical protein